MFYALRTFLKTLIQRAFSGKVNNESEKLVRAQAGSEHHRDSSATMPELGGRGVCVVSQTTRTYRDGDSDSERAIIETKPKVTKGVK